MRAAARSMHIRQDAIVRGLLLTLSAIAIIELVSHIVLKVPTLSGLLAVVAYVTFRWGRRPGLLSAAITSLYAVHYFSVPGELFEYTYENAVSVVLFPPAAAAVALLVGNLRHAVLVSKEQLRRQRDFSQAIDNSLAEGVYALDREGRVIFMNPAAARILGWTQAELLGKIMHDVIHFQHADGTPYPREECTGLGDVLRTGLTHRNDDDVFTRKDGTMIPVAYSSAPIMINGQIEGLAVAFRDMTERKRAEEKLRQSEATLRLIMQQIPAIIWTTDIDLRVTSVVGTALGQLDREPSEYIGKTFYELSETQDRSFPPIAAHLRALQGEPAEYEHAAGDRLFAARVEALRDAHGAIIGCLGLALDITERKRAEEALRRSEQRFRSLVQNAADIITVLSADGTIIYQSPSIERVLGYRVEDLLGQNFYKAIPIHPDDLQKVKTLLAELLAAPGTSVTSELRLQDAAGTWRYIESTATNLLHEPSVGGIVSNYRDITKRKRAEQRLITQYLVSRVLAETAGLDEATKILAAIGETQAWDYGALWTIDWHAQVLRCVETWHVASARFPKFEAISRRTAFARGEGLPGIIWAGGQVVWHADIASATSFPRLQAAFSEGLHVILGVPILLGGQVIAVLEFLSCQAREPDQDTIEMLQALGSQIGQFIERRRAEAEVQARAQQQAAVAELGQHALATTDLARLMDDATAVVARILAVEYSKVLELLPDGDSLLLRAGVGWKEGYIGQARVEASPDTHAGCALRSRDPVVVEDLRSDTRFRPPSLLVEHGVISSMGVVIHSPDDPTGQPFGVLQADTTRRRSFTEQDVHFLQAVANILATAIGRKASEERLAEAAQLEELERLRREFISSVSHDLRTPLAAAGTGLGMLEVSLAERLRADERSLLDNARRNIRRLELLITDLLTYNQLEAGVLQLERTPLDLRTVVADVLAAVHPLIQQKGQMLAVDLPDPLPSVGDRWRLEQVVINLLANAHEHTPRGTAITITGRQAAGTVVITVSDTGPGIPVEALEMIFQRFKQLDPATGGSGLGLTIVKRIVELHGGRVWAESAPGQGARFHVELPSTAPVPDDGLEHEFSPSTTN